MRQSQTAVLERNTVLSGEFFTEPFEVAWAREARWYFQVLERTGNPEISIATQLSPDGLTWIDLDSTEVRPGDAPMTSWAVTEFGHWLRLRGSVDGDGASVKVRIYLALKG
jgi:hypothetical protein